MAARKDVADVRASQLGFQERRDVRNITLYDNLTPRLRGLLFERKKFQRVEFQVLFQIQQPQSTTFLYCRLLLANLDQVTSVTWTCFFYLKCQSLGAKFVLCFLSFEVWKYVDDSTMSDTILKGQVSNIQRAVDISFVRTVSVPILNETKREEMRKVFQKKRDVKQIDVFSDAKILGVNILSDLKWEHFEIVPKATERLFGNSQLKRACVGPHEFIQFYCTCICPITEYVEV